MSQNRVPLPQAGTTRRVTLRECIAEPYRLFFPMAVFWGTMGVLYWVFVALGALPLPTRVHVYVQVYGFLWCFVVGFLGTAIPQFTGTRLLTPVEVILQCALSFVCMGFLFRAELEWAHRVFLVASTLLSLGIAGRFFYRTKVVPATLACVPFALLAAVLGALCTCLLGWGVQLNAYQLYLFSNTVLTQGMMLLLLMGVGGFLIKSILHVDTPQGPGNIVESSTPTRREWAHFTIVGFVVLASYVFEAFVAPDYAQGAVELMQSFLLVKTGVAIRVAVIAWFFVTQVNIHRFPTSGKLTALSLWAGLWLMMVGLFGEAAFDEKYRLAFRHLTLIGGFSFSIMGVATRVILSHARRPDLLNGRCWPFTTASILMLIGLATRFSVAFLPINVSRHYAYAGGVWVLGLLIWAAWVLPYCFKTVDSPSGQSRQR